MNIFYSNLDIIKSELLNKTLQKDIALKLGIPVKTLSYYLNKEKLIANNGRGKNPNSVKKRKYLVNDDFFEIPNLLNCYYGVLVDMSR